MAWLKALAARFRDQDRVAEADAHAPRVDNVVKEILDDDSTELPSHFSIGDERLCYAQTANIPAHQDAGD